MVSTFSSVVVVMLAGTFSWAAQAKLRNLTGTKLGFDTLGLPYAHVLSVAVPLAELAIAIGLLLAPTAGALACAAILVAFTVVLMQAKRSSPGEIRCGCFGAADTEPVTWVTYVRNAGLLFAALYVVAVPTTSVLEVGIVPFVAIATSAATAALIGALCVAVLTLRQRLGVVFSQGPGKPKVDRLNIDRLTIE